MRKEKRQIRLTYMYDYCILLIGNEKGIYSPNGELA